MHAWFVSINTTPTSFDACARMTRFGSAVYCHARYENFENWRLIPAWAVELFAGQAKITPKRW